MPRIEHLPGESMMDALKRFQAQRPRTREDEHRDRLLYAIQQVPFDKFNRDALLKIVLHMIEMGLLPNGVQD